MWCLLQVYLYLSLSIIYDGKSDQWRFQTSVLIIYLVSKRLLDSKNSSNGFGNDDDDGVGVGVGGVGGEGGGKLSAGPGWASGVRTDVTTNDRVSAFRA